MAGKKSTRQGEPTKDVDAAKKAPAKKRPAPAKPAEAAEKKKTEAAPKRPPKKRAAPGPSKEPFKWKVALGIPKLLTLGKFEVEIPSIVVERVVGLLHRVESALFAARDRKAELDKALNDELIGKIQNNEILDENWLEIATFLFGKARATALRAKNRVLFAVKTAEATQYRFESMDGAADAPSGTKLRFDTRAGQDDAEAEREAEAIREAVRTPPSLSRPREAVKTPPSLSRPRGGGHGTQLRERSSPSYDLWTGGRFDSRRFDARSPRYSVGGPTRLRFVTQQEAPWWHEQRFVAWVKRIVDYMDDISDPDLVDFWSQILAAQLVVRTRVRIGEKLEGFPIEDGRVVLKMLPGTAKPWCLPIDMVRPLGLTKDELLTLVKYDVIEGSWTTIKAQIPVGEGLGWGVIVGGYRVVTMPLAHNKPGPVIEGYPLTDFGRWLADAYRAPAPADIAEEILRELLVAPSQGEVVIRERADFGWKS